MISRRRLESIFLSWDWPLAAIITGVLALSLPKGLTYTTANGIFEVSISVLSIVFSVFFAALAILITSGDNEFVRFLENDGLYQGIVNTFRITFASLAIALLAAILLFITSLPPTSSTHSPPYPSLLLIAFGFIGLYSLFAAISASFDIIKYAQFRAQFLQISGPRLNDADPPDEPEAAA